MKKTVLIICICISNLMFGQLNMTQVGFLDIPEIHSTGLNGIWGYTDEAGNEYALVGTEDGVSIVDITDPANPNEIVFIPGMNSIWREIKTNGDYAYVTTEAEEGLLIIDLSPLPASTVLPTNYYNGPSGNEWNTAHSLYATDGYVYINGAGRGNGGLIILDVQTDPMNPVEVGVFDFWYVHDCYVRDDTAYLAHIYEGFFSIVDVTNKSAPVLLGSSMTPTNFSHNVWTSDDGNFAFTTDEVSNGFIGAFDVSNPANIIQLDKIQSSPGQGIVPHNVHVIGNFLVTSYYADGVVIHDITHPYNLVEVGNHDTNPHDDPNTNGCWGVYPYFPSGAIIASDREEGLFIFSADYQQGAYLEGNITELGTGNPIGNVQISIDGTDISDLSGVTGDYATGIAQQGNYDVTFFKILYYPQTISVNLQEGIVTNQDVVLEKIPQFNLSVEVLDATTLQPIENASVSVQHTYIKHEGNTDANGLVTLGLYYQDNYDVFAAKWGTSYDCFIDTMITNTSGTITLYVTEGYQDDFTIDLGWQSEGIAERGHWVREIPVGVMGQSGIAQNPFQDVGWDCGEYAFMTGNGSSTPNTDEVNQGEVVLISPIFNLNSFTNPHINFTSWYYNEFGYQPVNDTLSFYLFNGSETILIDQKYNGNTPQGQWIPNSIALSDYMISSGNWQLVITISDYNETVNVTEAAIDNFSITDFSLAAENKVEKESYKIYPNPANEILFIESSSEIKIKLFDQSGRLVLESENENYLNISHLQSGIYFVQIMNEDGAVAGIEKIIIQ